MRRLLFVNFVLFGPTIRRWMHRRRRNQRGVEVLLYVLVLLRVFYVYKREREGEARKRLEREMWLRNATETTMMKKTKKKKWKKKKDITHGETKALSAKRRRTSACRRRRTRPRRLPKTWKAFYNRVVEYYILRFFCDDVTTSFAFDFHQNFLSNFSLSLVSLTLSSVASEYDDDDDDDDDDDAFCEWW